MDIEMSQVAGDLLEQLSTLHKANSGIFHLKLIAWGKILVIDLMTWTIGGLIEKMLLHFQVDFFFIEIAFRLHPILACGRSQYIIAWAIFISINITT